MSDARSIRPDDGAAPDAAGRLVDYPPALIEVTLERMLAGRTFRRSQRHREFLAHVVRAGLEGRLDQLKEVIIGLEVFGRRLPEYDPRRDPIVRVEAGRIREKLARFYDGEGAAEPFRIVLPIGSYLPRFERRMPNGDVMPPSQSLAVLPFTNLSGDPDDAAFALGLADQLIDTLGRVPGLKVVARLSAMKARDRGMDLPGVGKLLGIGYVVEGSLQRSGARLRCIAQLSRAKDGLRLWSRRFDHDGDASDDLFDFQDLIAESVLEAIPQLQPAAPAEPLATRSIVDLRPPGTAHREARDLFERARYLGQQRSIEGYEKAIALLDRAVALDPSFAQAHSLLAATWANLTAQAMQPTFPNFHRVRAAALRALELDPLDGDARAMLAVMTHRIEYRWVDAEPMFDEALRLAASSPLTHSAYAWSLALNGRFEDAMRHARISQELDPLNLGLRANNAAVAKFARHFDHAIAEFEAVLELDPRHLFARVMLGVTLLVTGDVDHAMAHFEQVCREMPTHPSAHFCRVAVHGLRGDVSSGRSELDRVMAALGKRHFSRCNLALAQICLGDRDGMLASLEEAAVARDVLFTSIPAHGLFDRHARDDDRFHALLGRWNLTVLPREPARFPAPSTHAGRGSATLARAPV